MVILNNFTPILSSLKFLTLVFPGSILSELDDGRKNWKEIFKRLYY